MLFLLRNTDWLLEFTAICLKLNHIKKIYSLSLMKIYHIIIDQEPNKNNLYLFLLS